MAGINRIHIIGDFNEDERVKLGRSFESVLDDLYRKIFSDLGMKLKDGVAVIETKKDDVYGRTDWLQGIDVILDTERSGKVTLQEKVLTYETSTLTVEETKTSGAPGVWYTCTTQYYICVYPNDEKDPTAGLRNWMLVDFPALKRADARGLIGWRRKQNFRDGRRAWFRYVYFPYVPGECIIAQKHPSSKDS